MREAHKCNNTKIHPNQERLRFAMALLRLHPATSLPSVQAIDKGRLTRMDSYSFSGSPTLPVNNRSLGLPTSYQNKGSKHREHSPYIDSKSPLVGPGICVYKYTRTYMAVSRNRGLSRSPAFLCYKPLSRALRYKPLSRASV